MKPLVSTSLSSPVVVVGAWKKIHRDNFDFDEVRILLTLKLPTSYKSKGYKQQKEGVPEDDGFLRLYRETEGGEHLLIPRAYPIHGGVTEIRQRYTSPDDFPLVGWPPDKITLGPNKWQPYDQRAAYAALSAPPDTRTMGRLLVLGCGFGKTTLALKAAMTRHTPTAIVVDTWDLAEQWQQRIRDRRTGPGYEAPILTGAKSIINGDWKGKKIAIFTAQTLMQREPEEWPSAFRRNWGLAIFDEVHVMGAPVFSRVVPLFYGERWGLTATIERLDGLDTVFRAHLAPKPCFSDVTQRLTPAVHLHKLDTVCPDTFILGKKGTDDRYWSATRLMEAPDEVKRDLARRFGGRPNDVDSMMEAWRRKRLHSIPLTVSELANNRTRDSKVLRIIRKLEAEGRTILVLGNRTTQLKRLHRKYKGSGLVHGGTPRADRNHQLHGHKVVFMAQKIGTKGLDKPPLDTLVLPTLDPQLVTPANTQQSTGRIQREHAGKMSILVVAFVDPSSRILRPSLERYVKNMRQLLGRDVEMKYVKTDEE